MTQDKNVIDTSNSELLFEYIIAECFELFKNKNSDYGQSWRIMRYPRTFTDQIFIKAQRIRSIQETRINKVGDSLRGDIIGILNYSLMALMKNTHREEFESGDIEASRLYGMYQEQVSSIKELRLKKNHDYGEAWRDMRISSVIDLVLTKLLRIKQIEDNLGSTKVSEPVEAGIQDIANYALFMLALIDYVKKNPME